MTTSALLAIERLLLPNACVSCGCLVEESRPDDLVCRKCLARLRSVPRGCARCRQPKPPVGPCRYCADWPGEFRWAASAVWLGEEARSIVHYMKYRGYSRLCRSAAEVVARLVSQPQGGVLVPIPLGTKRMRQRGFNQAAELARELGAIWSLPVAERLLRRTRETKTQTKLTPEQRVENVEEAFFASATAASQGIILIDDVLTTGATLSAAAAALASAGCEEIGAITFARAMPLSVQLDLA